MLKDSNESHFLQSHHVEKLCIYPKVCIKILFWNWIIQLSSWLFLIFTRPLCATCNLNTTTLEQTEYIHIMSLVGILETVWVFFVFCFLFLICGLWSIFRFPPLVLEIFFFNFYLFLAVLGLRCCMRAFSSCGERGLLFIAVRRLLIVVASLVAEHGLQVHGLQ